MNATAYGYGKMRFPGICLKCGLPMSAGEYAYFIKVGRSKKTAHPGCKSKDVAQIATEAVATEDPVVLEVLRVFEGSTLISVGKVKVPLDDEYDGSMMFSKDKDANHTTIGGIA
jgi:hypothetical protein